MTNFSTNSVYFLQSSIGRYWTQGIGLIAVLVYVSVTGCVKEHFFSTETRVSEVSQKLPFNEFKEIPWVGEVFEFKDKKFVCPITLDEFTVLDVANRAIIWLPSKAKIEAPDGVMLRGILYKPVFANELWNFWKEKTINVFTNQRMLEGDNLLISRDSNILYPIRISDLRAGFRLPRDTEGKVQAAGLNLRGFNFSNQDLRKANFRGAILNGADFSGAELMGADFTGTKLRGANFSGANMMSTILREADFTRGKFDRAIMNSAILTLVIGEDATFYRANLTGATMQQGKFKNAYFFEAKMDKANLENAILIKANLKGANINQAILTGTIRDGAIMPFAWQCRVKWLTKSQP